MARSACSISSGFGTIPFPGSRTITLTSATDATDCARSGGTGNIDNTAPVSASNEGTNLANNSDSGQITVNCAAIQILKKSTKTGNPIVGSNDTPGLDPTPAVTTDNATFVITPNPKTGSGTLTVVDNGANDADTDYGEVCVSGVIPAAAGYSVDETVAPNGYGLPASNDPQNTGAVTAGSSCASGAASITFLDPPLYDLQVNFNDRGSGETSAAISCSPLEPPNATTPPTGWDTTSTYTSRSAPQIVTCTIKVDP